TYEADEIYMRLSEAYLLKAEAEARGGNSSAAQQTLYDLVSKRDSGYAKSSNTGEALLKEIFLQSRIELWGEGHEFFTNKRFNVGVDRTASSNHTHKLVKAAGKEFTYQIPLSIELNSNPYINAADQNPL
ncbi:RagB/SusD family nutrient uptake outer membrane protein, partial [Alistipes onderdonkii]